MLSGGSSSRACLNTARLSECRPIIGGAVISEATDSLERIAFKASGDFERLTPRRTDIHRYLYLIGALLLFIMTDLM